MHGSKRHPTERAGTNQGTAEGTAPTNGPKSRSRRGPTKGTAAQKPKRRKRVRSPHPGVKIKKRVHASGAVSWRAHFVDVDTGREIAITFEGDTARTQESREQWAKHKSAELARKRMDRAAGIRPVIASELDKAIAEYVKTSRATLKPKTLVTYQLAFAKLREWAKREGVKSTADLTPARLTSLRDYLIRAPRKSAKSGAKRGAKKKSATRRSPVSVNRELRSIGTLLNVWRQHALLPHLHRDDIADALSSLPVPHEQPAFLTPVAIKQLLAAALRHDAATFDATREEHAGMREKGSTARYDPIAPFVAFVLLTGMRRSEALAVEWQHVDLDALDHDGRKVGEIRLPASITKTNRGRIVGLEVSPALRKVLAAMRLRGGRGSVFGYTADGVEAARRRLRNEYGAPACDWQTLRSTCATYLTNAPGVFGAATVFLSAKQLGHSIAVAEKHYLGVQRGIPKNASTLEAAMQIENELAEVLGAVVVSGATARASSK